MEQRIGIASSLDRSITQAISAEALAAILESITTISIPEPRDVMMGFEWA